MRKLLAVVSVALGILAAHPGAYCQTDSDPVQAPVLNRPEFTARIDIIIDTPESIESLFADCIVEELQSLEGAVLTKNNPQYRITIMALPNRTRQENFGFTFSVLITRPLDKNLLAPLLMSKNLSENEKRLLILVGSNYERIEKNSLLTSSTDELGRVCKEIISSFDSDILQEDRRLWDSAWSKQLNLETETSAETE